MQMSVVFVVILSSALPLVATAQGVCPKKTQFYGLIDIDTPECQFDMLFSTELMHFGLIPRDTISTFHRGDGVYVGQVAPYGEVSPSTPAGAYRVTYMLSNEESARVDDLIRYAPDYFSTMQARIAAAARPILCGLITESARDFMRLGGQISYDLSLVPSRMSDRTPDTYMTINIVLDHCEAP
jgi:hypothetical protein